VAGGYPIILDISQRQIVVVGGGVVAMRKVKGLLAAGATRVRVVSPVIHDEMPAGIERVQAVYARESLAGAHLVFAATDSAEVNAAVVADAREIGALAARADEQDDGASDFTTPAVHRDGSLLLAVASGGSPALSAMIRDQLVAAIHPNHVHLADAMQRLRPWIRANIAADRRRDVYRSMCSESAMARFDKDGFDGLRRWLSEMYPELNG
jgi:precorrin-2 dehydrogenase/sirohydrochlorin ferrochelatase